MSLINNFAERTRIISLGRGEVPIIPFLFFLLRKVPTCEHLFLVQIIDFWDIFGATIYEKSLTERSVRDFCGEGLEICAVAGAPLHISVCP